MKDKITTKISICLEINGTVYFWHNFAIVNIYQQGPTIHIKL